MASNVVVPQWWPKPRLAREGTERGPDLGATTVVHAAATAPTPGHSLPLHLGPSSEARANAVRVGGARIGEAITLRTARDAEHANPAGRTTLCPIPQVQRTATLSELTYWCSEVATLMVP